MSIFFKSQSGQSYIFVPGITPKITSAILLNNRSTVQYKQQPEGVFIYLKGVEADEIDTVIRLNLR